MIICHYDDTNSHGGLEKQAQLLSRTMRAAGKDVIMLASTRKMARVGWIDDQGVRVRFFWTYASPQVSGRYFPAALIWAFQLMLWVMKHRREIKVLHCHQLRIHAFVAAIANRLFKIPAVLKSATGGTGADINTIGSRKYFGSPGRRFVARNVASFVATTKSIENDLLHYGVAPAKIAIIPNGLHLPPPEKTHLQVARARKALFLGRLAPDKNAAALASASIEVARSSALKVDFWGKGQCQAELQETITTGGDQSGVRYRGFSDDPGSILDDYGFLLLASTAEGLSNAMLEAMAHGVVPIATRVSGCVDHIIPGETGFYFDGIDHASLVAGLEQVAAVSEDQWRTMSGNVRRYAYARFDIDRVAEAYTRLYAALANEGSVTR